MRKLIVVVVCASACSLLPTLPNGSQGGVRVSPHSATITVGQSQPLSAASVDSSGDSVGVASVTWTSSTPSVASVSGSGVASGVGVGVATVVASSSRGTSDSSLITVVAGGCAAVAKSAHLHGHATFRYQYSATIGSVAYQANDSATMVFTVDATTVNGHGHQLWMGPATGTGSETEKRTDNGTSPPDIKTLTGSGPLVVSDINLSHVVVTLDPSTCEFTMEGIPYIDVTESPTPGALGASWIGWFRTAPTPFDSAAHSSSLATHSATWMTANYLAATRWYVPLGFSSDYFGDGAADDGSTGAVQITYEVTAG